MHRKSQAAFEFLNNYAWAFIAIIVAIGALYYFGVFDFGKYLPQKCLFTSQFKCLDFTLQPDVIRVKLVNNIGEDISVTSVQITNDASPSISCATLTIDGAVTSVPFDWLHETIKEIWFTDCTGGAYLSGENAELKITMKYYAINTPSHPEHEINGKINGKVTSS